MGSQDHYVFMDGCVVKGCRFLIDFERTFGEYADLLEELYERGHWGRGARRLFGSRAGYDDFDDWATEHVHVAQSTQNLRTGAARVNGILQSISGHVNIHLFGTSAAGAAIIEYFLLCDPGTLYYRATDPHNDTIPNKKYAIDTRIASMITLDAPTNWVAVKHNDGEMPRASGKGTIGDYLVRHTRIKAGDKYGRDRQTARMEDVPDTWVEAQPVAGVYYDNRPHYEYLPKAGLERHIYTGSHMSLETRDFLERVWA
ncbi:MAG: hypothetical protein M3014_06320 [Chloroflexota bacterium]|nr:hypothetical protein [Chloroflexota bacterium]